MNDLVDDFCIIERTLFNRLSEIATASSLKHFSYEHLLEIQSQFLEQVIERFNLHNPQQNELWHWNKANFYARQLYPWYLNFLGLLEFVSRSYQLNSEIIIELTA